MYLYYILYTLSVQFPLCVHEESSTCGVFKLQKSSFKWFHRCLTSDNYNKKEKKMACLPLPAQSFDTGLTGTASSVCLLPLPSLLFLLRHTADLVLLPLELSGTVGTWLGLEFSMWASWPLPRRSFPGSYGCYFRMLLSGGASLGPSQSVALTRMGRRCIVVEGRLTFSVTEETKLTIQ